MPTKLDKTDRMLLKLLQQDADLSVAQLAEKVFLTSTPCWKRIQRLEERGLIKRRVALLDEKALERNFFGFVQIKTISHSDEWRKKFEEAVLPFPEVMECFRMAGEYDYLIKVQVKDMEAFDKFYKKLTKAQPNLQEVTSSFAMQRLKETHELPIDV